MRIYTNRIFKSRSTVIIWSICIMAIVLWYTFVYDWGERGILHLKQTHPELVLAKLDAGKNQPNADSVLKIKSLLDKLAAQSHESPDSIANATKGGQLYIMKLYGKRRSTIYILQMVDRFGETEDKKTKFKFSRVQYFDKLKMALMFEGLRDKFGS
jgi:hypothetical protein